MFNTRLGEAFTRRDLGAAARAARRPPNPGRARAFTLPSPRAGRFWPTPGSTMSQTVCFWRAAWGLDGAASITSCEDICVAP